MAMVGAASAALLMGAAPAVAQTADDGVEPSPGASVQPEYDAEGVLECTRELANESWNATCGRNPVDGDPGGVSGFVDLRSTDLANYGRIDFQARGDKITLNSDMPGAAYFRVWTKKDGGAEWKRVYRHVEDDGAVSGKEVSLDLPEDVRVWLAVSIVDEPIGAAQGTLIA